MSWRVSLRIADDKEKHGSTGGPEGVWIGQAWTGQAWILVILVARWARKRSDDVSSPAW